MPRTTRALAMAALLAATGPAPAAEMVTAVLPVGYRDAAELLDVLRPLVPSPGSISAFQGQLVVRTTPENMDEIRALILELDRAPANLLISVRHGLDEEVRRDLAAAAARIRSGGAAASIGSDRTPRRGAGVSAGGRHGALSLGADRRVSTRAGDEVQSVRVLEGREAFIRSGESVPVGEEQVTIIGGGVIIGSSVRYEDFDSGFFVRPRLNGEQVTLDIIRRQRTLLPDQRASVDEVSTSVTGVLGRWMELAGTRTLEQRTRRDLGSIRSRSTRIESGLYLKVERLPR